MLHAVNHKQRIQTVLKLVQVSPYSSHWVHSFLAFTPGFITCPSFEQSNIWIDYYITI